MNLKVIPIIPENSAGKVFGWVHSAVVRGSTLKDQELAIFFQSSYKDINDFIQDIATLYFEEGRKFERKMNHGD